MQLWRPVVCEQWCNGNLNKNTDFQTYRYPLELVKKDNLLAILTGKYCFHGLFFIYYLLSLVNVYTALKLIRGAAGTSDLSWLEIVLTP